MKYSLRILKKKNVFKRHKDLSLNALNDKYFWTLSYNHCFFLVSLNYPILNFKKTVCPKKCLDAALVHETLKLPYLRNECMN